MQIAKRVDESEIKEGEDKTKYKHAYVIPDMEEPVYLHDSCVLREEKPGEMLGVDTRLSYLSYLPHIFLVRP